MDVRVNDCVHLLSLVVDQVLRRAQIVLLERLVRRSVAEEQVCLDAVGVRGVEGLFQLLLLLLLKDDLLGARLDLVGENRRVERELGLVLRDAGPAFFLQTVKNELLTGCWASILPKRSSV